MAAESLTLTIYLRVLNAINVYKQSMVSAVKGHRMNDPEIKRIKEGWYPYGSMVASADKGFYAQAMVKTA